MRQSLTPNLYHRSLILAIFCLLLGMQSTVLAQKPKGASYLLKEMDKWIEDYDNNDYKLLRAEIGTISAKGGKGMSLTFRELVDGSDYQIRAFSNPDEIGDIDLSVYVQDTEGKWVLVGRDVSKQPGARYPLESPNYGLYKIELSGYDIKNELGQYGLLICRKKQ